MPSNKLEIIFSALGLGTGTGSAVEGERSPDSVIETGSAQLKGIGSSNVLGEGDGQAIGHGAVKGNTVFGHIERYGVIYTVI